MKSVDKDYVKLFLVSNKFRTLRHALFVFLLLFQFFPEIAEAVNAYQKYSLNRAISISLLLAASIASSIVLIYINVYWLLSRYLLRKQYFMYLAFTAVEFVLDFSITYIIHLRLRQLTGVSPFASILFDEQTQSLPYTVQSLVMPVVFLGAIVSILLFREWLIQEEKFRAEEKARLLEGIHHLKSQINPHFLFNTLNNIVTLIETDPPKAASVVYGLSDILRYNLHQITKERVAVADEIETQRRILEIEKIRRNNFSFRIIVNGEIAQLQIPPYLFINFVENAIKHSADDVYASYVYVQIELGNSKLLFSCLNSIGKSRPQHSSGIGLKNVTQQLTTLYGDNYDLKWNNNGEQFNTSLTIPI
jgi:two-component system, LytTR family, sensor kinase